MVELFQSQGCSSCPPANANLIALSDRPDLLTLSFGVTYWDDLGWNDTFASPRYTAKQWDYAHAFQRGEVATPEVVVNGRADVVGSGRPELEALIRREDRGASGPGVTLKAGRVDIGAAEGSARSGRVLLVRYDPAVEQVAIRRGENGGRTLFLTTTRDTGGSAVRFSTRAAVRRPPVGADHPLHHRLPACALRPGAGQPSGSGGLLQRDALDDHRPLRGSARAAGNRERRPP